MSIDDIIADLSSKVRAHHSRCIAHICYYNTYLAIEYKTNKEVPGFLVSSQIDILFREGDTKNSF